MNVEYNLGCDRSLDKLPDVLTVEDVKAVLRCGKNTVSELLRTGQLKGWKIGTRWKIAKTALVDYIQRAERTNDDGERLHHTA
jgi:excisionase family DNA binding protein